MKYSDISKGFTGSRQRRIREHFSASYYLSQFPEVDRATIENPIKHFLLYWNENGYDPSPLFSMSDYLAANPDVAAHGINPLVHYVEKGIAERRPLSPGKQLSQVVEPIAKVGFKTSLRDGVDAVFGGSGLPNYLSSIGFEFDWDPTQVDPDYYGLYFPGEIINDCDQHYDEIGWRMGLNPTSWFNTNFYLNFYTDVRESGINPFFHFVTQGYFELRIPSEPHYRNFVTVLNGPSIESEAQSWVDPGENIKIVEVDHVLRKVLKSKKKKGPLVVSLGHSRYLSDVGGIQLYTFVEAQKFNQLDINYLHFSPSRPLPVLADRWEKDLCVKITFNNEELSGDVLLSDLAEVVDAISPDVPPISLIVNSLYGWHPELLVPIIQQLGSDKHFWIFHDYSVFCSNPTLNFENSFSCHNPKVGSGMCSTCRFGQTRAEHASRINQLLESCDWQLVTPSVSTSANIAKFLKVDSSQVLTIPHGQINVGRKLRYFKSRPRIAFVGHPVLNKGWLNFTNFVNLGMKEFDFYHFGAVDSNEPGVHYFPLTSQFNNLDKARDLLVENQIDAVFICPTWEETFCFVAYEALAAVCQIICNIGSGNVVDAAFKNAIFLDVEDAQSVDRVKAEVMKARQVDRYISDFVFSGTIASEYSK